MSDTRESEQRHVSQILACVQIIAEGGEPSTAFEFEALKAVRRLRSDASHLRAERDALLAFFQASEAAADAQDQYDMTQSIDAWTTLQNALTRLDSARRLSQEVLDLGGAA